MNAIEQLSTLVKALEAGGYNAAPGSLTQGSALQTEDLATVMTNVCFSEKAIILQKMIKSSSAKATLVQFDRQLSYGAFGGSAQIEGAIGQEETSDYVRVVVPMCYYSHVRRVTLVANMVNTVDGRDASERAAADAAIKIAADIEFDCFQGKAHFSNAGVFDGNPNYIPALPNMLGLDAQIRQSDAQRNARDLMFGEFGSDDSNTLVAGGVVSQFNIEDLHVRSAMNHGSADLLLLDPKSLAAYNKNTYGQGSGSLQRIVLAGSPQDASGADLRRQWVSGGVVELKASRFLSGKSRPQSPRSHPNAPGVPGTVTSAYTAAAAGTAFLTTDAFMYYVTAVNEIGESIAAAGTLVSLSGKAGYGVVLTIPAPGAGGAPRYYNVYRSATGAVSGTALASCKFIGRVAYAGSNTTFTDLGNRMPGFVVGYLLQGDTFEMRELAGYSRAKLAVTDLSIPEAHFRFTTLTVPEPRKNVILDNIQG
jgi:hypothetical protein